MHFILLMMLCGWIFMVSAFTVWCNRGTTTETGACASGPSDLSCGSCIFCGLRWNADACQLLPWPGSKNVWHWWLWPIWQFKTPSGIYIYILSLFVSHLPHCAVGISLFSCFVFLEMKSFVGEGSHRMSIVGAGRWEGIEVGLGVITSKHKGGLVRVDAALQCWASQRVTILCPAHLCWPSTVASMQLHFPLI